MISAVVLAAGLSTRYGVDNKLTAALQGVPLIRRTVEAVVAATFETWVVTGYESPDVRAALIDLRISFVHNSSYQDGMGGSIAAGVSATHPVSEGILIVPGDMPNVSASTYRRMAEMLSDPSDIVTLSDGEKQSSPSLFGAGYREALCQVRGDQGAKNILQSSDRVKVLQVSSYELADFDERA